MAVSPIPAPHKVRPNVKPPASIARPFNPFQENTPWSPPRTGSVIIDPGCYEAREEQALERLIEREGLKPVYC